jgi:ring-1,2-phenylacetyl-CoA epoxidase subunit PaaB
MSATDTQWPRFQVFHQEEPDKPHVNAGTVHAPDVELALQNARDVFVRRPDCASLWVVPAHAISSLTAEELAQGGLPDDAGSPIERETYFAFVKRVHIGSHEYAGSVEADSPEDAMQQAVEAESDVLVWWVVPEHSVATTSDEDAPSLFEPARSKRYRTPAFYHTTTLMRKLREKGNR